MYGGQYYGQSEYGGEIKKIKRIISSVLKFFRLGFLITDMQKNNVIQDTKKSTILLDNPKSVITKMISTAHIIVTSQTKYIIKVQQ